MHRLDIAGCRLALEGKDLHPRGGAFSQGIPEGRVSGIIGFQVLHALHLNDEADGGLIARGPGGDEFLQVFDSPLRGCIGEAHHPVLFQRDSLDLHKSPFFRVLPVEIKA